MLDEAVFIYVYIYEQKHDVNALMVQAGVLIQQSGRKINVRLRQSMLSICQYTSSATEFLTPWLVQCTKEVERQFVCLKDKEIGRNERNSKEAAHLCNK